MTMWRVHRGLLVILAGTGLMALTACTPVDRHKVLTFFFTGVPPLGQEDKEAEEERRQREEAGKGELLRLVQAQVNKQRRAVPAGRFVHGIYAANLCNLCHETSASGGFRGFGKKEGAQTAAAGAVSGKLVAPVSKLCTGCHGGKSVQAAEAAGLWVHGPVSTGYCLLCHAPHAGPERYHLLKKPEVLCMDCHAGGRIFREDLHRDARDCLQCHNAHMGRDSRLLRTEYREAW